MKYAVSATATFAAGHVIDGHPLCSRPHGHTWTVRATASHEEMRYGYPMGSVGLSARLDDLALELSFRDLAEMGAGVSPPALAAWFFERLAVFTKSLSEVSVWNEVEGGTVSK